MTSYREYQVVLGPGLHKVVKRPSAPIVRSVMGCFNCKKRKVKCDETKNTCLKCQKRGDVCRWPTEEGRVAKGKTGRLPAFGEVTLEGKMGENAGLKARPRFEERPNLVTESSLVRISKELDETVPLSTMIPFESLPLGLTLGRIDTTDFMTLPPTLIQKDLSLDAFFLKSFASKFLPPFAQVHFRDGGEFQEMVLGAARDSFLLREVFIACGASFVASENVLQRNVAHKRYTEAISKYVQSLKGDTIEKQETWLFIAAQVLQVLCLREPFFDSNATRCALHFALAHKFVSNKLSQMTHDRHVAPLEKILMENFIFHYPLIIFFCDHKQLSTLVPNPFQFYRQHQSGLFLAFWEESMAEYGLNPLVAFHIAAKCSWLCRLSLPLNEADKNTNLDLLAWAETSLRQPSPVSSETSVQVTNSLTVVVLSTSIILLRKMTDMQGCRLLDLQGLVASLRREMEKKCHATTVFPIWLLMVSACASESEENRLFFRSKLTALHSRSKSKLIERILVQLDDVWTVCDAEEPFELLFDTDFLSQICS